MQGRIAATLGISVVALLAPASAASATDFFVNSTTGNNANDCLSAGSPCLTIGLGTGALAKAADSEGNRVLLADGLYAENLTGSNAIRSGITLSSSDGDVDPKPVLAGPTSIDSTGGSIDHLELTTAADPVLQVSGPGMIADNAFTNNGSPPGVRIALVGGSGNVTIERNEFTNDLVGDDTAVAKVVSGLSLSVLNNEISDFWRGVFVSQGSPTVIRGNEITGIRDIGEGISIAGGLGHEITGNRIVDDAPAILAGTGILVGFFNAPASATLSRNRILGAFAEGISAFNTDALSSNSDVVDGSSFSLVAHDAIGAGNGNATVTNATFWDASADNMVAAGAHITLNSSITGDASTNNGGTCAISFSRGDATGTPGDLTDCNDFQTTDDPIFVNEALNDFHLQSTSPMIDAGDPASAAGLLDFDLEPRAMGGVGGCAPVPPRRDIGADEFVKAPAPGSACPAVITPVATTPAKKKCKKGRKLKKGKCVRKKRKKK